MRFGCIPAWAKIQRPFWGARLAETLRAAPIVWLSGVRRSGKTTIARSIAGAHFLNCDLPSVQREMDDPEAFSATVEKRLLHGGMPQMLLAPKPDPGFYAEWMDSCFARDVSELFRVERRSEFLLLLRLLLRQNGGMATVVHLAKQCGVTRPTVMSWIEAMRITHVVHLIRPFHGNGDSELVKQPKIYAFDTGFVAHENGWSELQPEERGLLWENVVLEHLLSRPSQPEVHYWRDKLQREVDFIIPRGRSAVDAIACTWDLRRIDIKGMKAFRALYPKGSNFVLSPGVVEPYTRVIDGVTLTIASPSAIRG